MAQLDKSTPQKFMNPQECVDRVVAHVGKSIVLGIPLGLGKPNHLVNAFYQRAKSDPSINLKIMTALTLERPKGKSFFEQRFLGPFADRVFGDYPDLDYELDRMAKKLPANIEVVEFYFPAGKYLKNTDAQRHYVSSNYTHVARDMMDHGVNVLAQMICEDSNQPGDYSLSCNPDVTLDLVEPLKEKNNSGQPTAIVGQLNNNLPFMYGDAVVPSSTFDFVVDNPEQHYKVFGPPKMAISDADFMIGLYGSLLARDDGELQVGIGSLGDSFVYSLVLRQRQNHIYKNILADIDAENRFGQIIKDKGGVDTFEKGLLGATEMLVDGFLHLFDTGIIKRQVFDDVILQRLLNQNRITYKVNGAMVMALLEEGRIRAKLRQQDFEFLQAFGIFLDSSVITYKEGKIQHKNGDVFAADLGEQKSRQYIFSFCLGDRLKNGKVMHGGFFLGPQAFYEALRTMPKEKRNLISMKSVRKINHLYGHEEIDRLHRKNARFFNTCLMMTLLGAAVSDGLEDGRVVSGVGGQYNFVSMAQELPDGYSVIQLRSTRPDGKKLKSNIVWSYGHATIPRHLRDIVITEYGIADIRGQTDEEVIKRLLNIADSRFQPELLKQAKKAGKLNETYEIPESYRNNYPEAYKKWLRKWREQELFPRFPFGTDFTEEEITLGAALKSLKKKSEGAWGAVLLVLQALFKGKLDTKYLPHLKRMGLDTVKSPTQWFYRRLLCSELKQS